MSKELLEAKKAALLSEQKALLDAQPDVHNFHERVELDIRLNEIWVEIKEVDRKLREIKMQEKEPQGS